MRSYIFTEHEAMLLYIYLDLHGKVSAAKVGKLRYLARKNKEKLLRDIGYLQKLLAEGSPEKQESA